MSQYMGSSGFSACILLYVHTYVHMYVKGLIKTHDSESRGQEEAAVRDK